MRAIIVVEDNRMSVDGKPSRNVDLSALAAGGIHAVQWYDSYGEEEFKAGFDSDLGIPTCPPNRVITDFSAYQSYVDAYEIENAEKTAEEDAARAEIEAQRANAEMMQEKAAHDQAAWQAESERLGHAPPPEWQPPSFDPAASKRR